MSADIIRELYLAQSGCCFICDKPMDVVPCSKRYPLGWTREHVRPKSKGGKGSSHQNITLAHAPCNLKKSDREPTQAELVKCAAVYAKVSEIRALQGDIPTVEELPIPGNKPIRKLNLGGRLSDQFTCGCPHGTCKHMFSPGCREARYCDCITKGIYHRVGANGCQSQVRKG